MQTRFATLLGGTEVGIVGMLCRRASAHFHECEVDLLDDGILLLGWRCGGKFGVDLSSSTWICRSFTDENGF